ncbi:MAG TPA: hypothetical protein VFV54_08100 [Thermoanaerobaculia bacterium]|nr:hypothetical protein [Thermoanaerobaculia bacterium]
MYDVLLTSHSWLRWAVLIFGVIALVGAIRKHARKDLAPDRSSLGFLISCDLQLLVGLLLFFVSPFFSVLTQAPGAAMRDASTRFFAVEHTLGMIVAIALVHVGRVIGKRSASPNRYRTAAILFAVALLIFAAAIPWPALSNARPLFRW